ncbi:unnamed protein product, partial [Mesorhabditis belari]|uniref:serine C-palmitoyltransferase n=1 Tax=Mesorhabditis belari TaxID=2138241 RepID=A0AAF3FJP6_9BILA
MSKLPEPHCINNFTRQLMERTDILECAWNKQEQENGDNEDEEEGSINKGKNESNANIETDQKTRERSPNEFEKISYWRVLSVYVCWVILFLFGYFREFLRNFGLEKSYAEAELEKQKHFPPLFNDIESVYKRNCYMRVRDVFERPIASTPGAKVNLLDRYTEDHNWSFKFTGTQTEVINVASYNYLGFAQNEGVCAEAAAAKIDEEGISNCSTIHEFGRSLSQDRLEMLVAKFLNVDDSICFSMGFATNSMNAPSLVDKNSLIISDELNHASLILGCRLSGANTKVFKHNDMASLETILRDSIAYGNLKTLRPYTKGIYSMEGSIANLARIIELKKKYGAYLYLDEAHSIGAMGRSGRGMVEYWDCNPKDIDILMGTFTKSFGSVGGYIAGSKKVIDHLRVCSPTGYYSSPMSPPICEQVYKSMSIIMGLDGTNDGQSRVDRLARNSRYLRLRLKQQGYIVYGSDDSPVVPVLLYYPSFCGFYGREMLARGIAAVVVSFPATVMTEGRIRFCLSAAHTKEQLDQVLQAMAEIGVESWSSSFSKNKKVYENMNIQW